MDKKKDLLEGTNNFSRIRKLNAADAGKKTIYNSGRPGELYGLEHLRQLTSREHTATTITQNHSVGASNGGVAFIPGTATEGNAEIVTEEVIETNDNMFKTHVKTLSSKEGTV
ncbi:AIF_collapsed_G0031790.mRNA.1.CDS.1 [Saccharomyces cerevisiae]|nr:AIF_collapsed_G0031790.mRNA.1.CDS.1 [Saccharomyces cerevisiae]